MYKKYLYDNLLNMVGFGDRNMNSTEAARKQSDIYTDAPFLVLPFDKIPKSAIRIFAFSLQTTVLKFSAQIRFKTLRHGSF